MNVQFAIDKMKDNRYVARSGWGERCYLYLDGEIFMYSRNGFDSPWQAPHPDLLADDWNEAIPQR